jgi:hypothetical protein
VQPFAEHTGHAVVPLYVLMKYLLLLGASLLLATPVHAQFGLRAGANLVRLGLANDTLSTSSRLGYQLGLFYQVPLSQRWSLVPEVQFSRERIRVNSALDRVAINYRLRFSYLNLPIVARFTIGSVYVEAGPQFSWLVGGHGEGTISFDHAIISRIDQATTEVYRRFTAGPCLGIGVKLPAGLDLSVRAYQGLGNSIRQDKLLFNATPIPYQGRSSQHRQTLQVSLAYQLANHQYR